MKFDKELLIEVLGISAPSGNEDDAQNYVDEWVTKNIPDAVIDIDDKGNLYVTKGQSLMYPTFVGHLDDVHSYHAKKKILELNDFLYAMDETTMEQIGTAGDDKVGMYLCLEALRTYDYVKCFFPVEEEWGTVGTSACDMEFFKDSQYVIQSDRQKAEDIVTRISGTDMTSKTFNKVAKRVGKKYGYSLCTHGGLTDVGTLKEQGLNVCAINIASGYYNPHTDSEVVSVSDVANMIDTVADLVKALGTKVWNHKTKKKVWSYGYDRYADTVPSGAGNYKYNPQTNQWDDVDTNTPINVYMCSDCGKQHDADDMITADMCKACAEWYQSEYDYKIPDMDKLDAAPEKYPDNNRWNDDWY